MAPRKSRRILVAETKKGIDESIVKKRAQAALDNLEKDNYMEDPLPDLVIQNNYGTSEDSVGYKRGKRRRGNTLKRLKLAEYFKTRFAKTFAQLVKEDCAKNPNGPNYLTAQAPKSKYPPKTLCAVCGFPSKYKCTVCSARYCSLSCKEIHVDTRCLKWVV